MRSIEERLQEYSKATRGLIPQLKGVLAQVPEVAITVSSHTALNDAIRLYQVVADDLDKILRGEELQRWRIEGEISPHPGGSGGPT